MVYESEVQGVSHSQVQKVETSERSVRFSRTLLFWTITHLVTRPELGKAVIKSPEFQRHVL